MWQLLRETLYVRLSHSLHGRELYAFYRFVAYFICATNKSELLLYTVNHKKRHILFLTITLTNLNRFLQFLYRFNREKILHACIMKFLHHPIYVRTLPWKIKTYIFAVVHKT